MSAPLTENQYEIEIAAMPPNRWAWLWGDGWKWSARYGTSTGWGFARSREAAIRRAFVWVDRTRRGADSTTYRWTEGDRSN